MAPPQVTCIYVGWDGDDIIVITVKLRNIRHDPRVTLSIESERSQFEGFSPYVVIQGYCPRRGGRGGTRAPADHSTASSPHPETIGPKDS